MEVVEQRLEVRYMMYAWRGTRTDRLSVCGESMMDYFNIPHKKEKITSNYYMFEPPKFRVVPTVTKGAIVLTTQYSKYAYQLIEKEDEYSDEPYVDLLVEGKPADEIIPTYLDKRIRQFIKKHGVCYGYFEYEDGE